MTGNVQGVGFRFFAQRVAGRIGVSGYAKNLQGGQVEVYAIGTEEQLKALKKELERGPGAADVEGVAEEEAEMDAKYSGGFTIERESW